MPVRGEMRTDFELSKMHHIYNQDLDEDFHAKQRAISRELVDFVKDVPCIG